MMGYLAPIEKLEAVSPRRRRQGYRWEATCVQQLGQKTGHPFGATEMVSMTHHDPQTSPCDRPVICRRVDC